MRLISATWKLWPMICYYKQAKSDITCVIVIARVRCFIHFFTIWFIFHIQIFQLY